MNQNHELLRAAYDAWMAATTLRANRERYKRYTYGDQWSDLVADGKGSTVREESLMIRHGHRPLTNNLLRQLVKAVVGRYRTLADESKRYADPPAVLAENVDLADIDARMLEEFIISGVAVQRVCSENRMEGSGVWVDNVDPRRFFVNRFTDPRGLDIDLVGMLHNMTIGQIINRFSGGSRARARELRELFDAPAANQIFGADTAVGITTTAAHDFFNAPVGRCRVIEVWRLESRPVTARGDRIHMDFVWRQHWLAPDGTVLFSGNSAFAHGSHPFAVTFYPLTDGEVHSFVDDLIDQQRAVNRIVTMIDSMLATSAKGTLLFPVRRMAKGWTIRDVAQAWSEPDSVIPIDGAGEMPSQVITNTATSGAYQALSMQMQMLSDVSGLSDAMLGRAVSAATGAEKYEAQVRNAAVTLTDLLDTFTSFTLRRDRKAARTISNH